MMEYIGIAEILLLGVILLIGSAVILFSTRGEASIIGAMIIVGTIIVLYINHSYYLKEVYIQERFEQGDKLECGLWRGEHILISKEGGWRWDKDVALVKGDQIFSDPGLCRVIGKEPPEPPVLAYAGILAVLIALLVSTRSLIMGVIKEKGADHDTE